MSAAMIPTRLEMLQRQKDRDRDVRAREMKCVDGFVADLTQRLVRCMHDGTLSGTLMTQRGAVLSEDQWRGMFPDFSKEMCTAFRAKGWNATLRWEISGAMIRLVFAIK